MPPRTASLTSMLVNCTRITTGSMFAAPLSMMYASSTPDASTASGISRRYRPGMFVPSTAMNPPVAHAAVALPKVASVIAVAALPARW
jgi:hypothetical protein